MWNLRDIFVFVAAVLTIVWWRRKRLWNLAAQIPGYDGLPLAGIIHKFIGVNYEDTYATLINLMKPFDSTFKFWGGPKLFLVVRDPADIKIATNSDECLNKPQLFYKHYLSYCLFSMNSGDEYKFHKKSITPVFYPASLQRCIPIVNGKTMNFLRRFDTKLSSNDIEFTHIAMDFILDSLLASMFGIDYVDEKRRLKFVEDTDEVFEIATQRIFKFWFMLDPIFRFSKNYKPFKQRKRDIYEFIDEITAEFEDEYERGIKSPKRKSQIYLEQLYKIRHSMTRDQLREEVFAFLIGAFDTTGKALSATLLLLAMNQDAQDKVVEEINKCLTSVNDEVDEETLNNMEYLEMVMKESLRLLPVALILARQVKNEFKLTTYAVPSGTTIVFLPLVTHTDKTVWGDDADEFKPERFKEENFEKIHNYAYFPFSKGPRMCLGYRYAWMAMKVFLCKFLSKYRVTTHLKYSELELHMMMTTKIKQGFTFKVERR